MVNDNNTLTLEFTISRQEQTLPENTDNINKSRWLDALLWDGQPKWLSMQLLILQSDDQYRQGAICRVTSESAHIRSEGLEN